MTTDNAITPGKGFVPRILPWLVAPGALVVYLLTLNQWVTISSLPQVVKIAGWDWQPNLFAPAHFLVTYPFRWLPDAWVPVALNLFATVCGGLTLALLARSVALLPHDRTGQQRQLEHSEFSVLSIRTAWIPPLLAVFACGLQMTFWENATVASSEMLDLLLFAYVVRCLLEYRIGQRQSWLIRASLVYGVGMANNWAMVGLLPVFLCALVWIKGLGFFNPRFLLRMGLYGLAGMSLYLLLPLVYSLSDDPQVGFGQALWFVLVSQKNILLVLFKQLSGPSKDVALLLCLTSFLPLLVLSIRWPASFGDLTHSGVVLTKFVFHVVHGLFLIACVWVAFDPRFSPRQAWRELGFPLPFLTLYYLSALSVGYFSGYFLLLFGRKTRKSRVPGGPFSRLTDVIIPAAIWVLLIGTPTMLILKNLPQIRTNDSSTLSQYAELARQSLPATGAVVLSDDSVRLFLLQAALTRGKAATNYLLLDTQALNSRYYHRFLCKKYPGRWDDPTASSKSPEPLSPPVLIRMLTEIAQKSAMYYLHPSFGYYFEQFYSEPHGLVYELKSYSTNAVVPPLPAPELIRANEDFWRRVEPDVLEPLVAQFSQLSHAEGQGPARLVMKMTRSKREVSAQATVVGSYYSRALNDWGVQLQRHGRLKEAAQCFQRAVDLYADNVVAQINLQHNTNLQAGQRSAVKLSKSIEDRFGKYRSWDQIISYNGPFDEPSFCYELGRRFAAGGLYRQAAQQFERVIEFAPDNFEARLWLAQLYALWRMPNKTLKLVAEIRDHPELMPFGQTNETDLVALEAAALFAQTNHQAAHQTIQAALQRHPGDTNLLAVAMSIYTAYGRHTNALAAVEDLLHLLPDDVNYLVNKGFLCMQLEAFADAIPALSRALTLQTTNYQAMFNRAIAYLRTDNLPAAQADYLELNRVFPTAYQVYYGLGEIAHRQKDGKAAIRYYESYLSNSIPNSEETKFVSARLAELKAGAR